MMLAQTSRFGDWLRDIAGRVGKSEIEFDSNGERALSRKSPIARSVMSFMSYGRDVLQWMHARILNMKAKSFYLPFFISNIPSNFVIVRGFSGSARKKWSKLMRNTELHVPTDNPTRIKTFLAKSLHKQHQSSENSSKREHETGSRREPGKSSSSRPHHDSLQPYTFRHGQADWMLSLWWHSKQTQKALRSSSLIRFGKLSKRTSTALAVFAIIWLADIGSFFPIVLNFLISI